METADMSTEAPAAPSTRSAPRKAVPLPSQKRRSLPPFWALAGGAILVIVAAVAAVALLTGSDKDVSLQPGKPRVVSADELTSYVRSNHRTVFWAGTAAPGFKLELTEVKGPRVFVRYLTTAAQAGDPRAAYTTIATYPMQGAYERLRSASSRPGAVVAQTPGGAATLYYKKTPSNVYVARPGSNFLVEIFAPQPRAAMQLAGSSSLVQIR
jgi:hypothetical protein